MQLCCTNTMGQRLLWSRALWKTAASAQTSPHVWRKESRNRAHLKDRFCPITPWITSRVSSYALPTACLADCISSPYLQLEWLPRSTDGSRCPLCQPMQTCMSRIPITPLIMTAMDSVSAPLRMSKYSHGKWELNHVLFKITHDFTTVTLLS